MSGTNTLPDTERDPADRVRAQWLDQHQQQIWRTYLLGSSRLTERLDADLRRHGLDLGEYEILVVLEETPTRRVRMSELAEAVHQSRSRLTHTVARLEKRGLVTRVMCPEDRRGVWAELTEAGFQLLKTAAPSHVTAVRQNFVEAVDPADFEALGRVFQAVLDVDSDGA
ncbi:MarR family winged helix-turn-helix transcriptional regulator [Propionibacteriaceae bacterium Y2011]|uniref:MarR family winged helix-turn-helix transcriptional regulator n=1 Tax=Microlunatus sp. Y2014 TaxID=3418488 RepID=UPI003B49D0C6